MRFIVLVVCLLQYFLSLGQPLRESARLGAQLKKLVRESGLDSAYDVGETETERISLAVIIPGRHPVIGGVNADNFIYPASVYKMYVAMEVLRQISEGDFALSRSYIVPTHNAVDKSREISFDPRPLLRAGDTVTVNYLLDLMITRSDNSAANCLIDIAGRKNINVTMQQNGWRGSEVTRKFLKRSAEDFGYDSIRGTQTNARHAAEFLYKISMNQLINPWVSLQMKALLSRQLDDTKLARGLPANVMFSHKTGWWSWYTHDAGIVETGSLTYIVALFTPVKEEQLNGRMQMLAEKIHALIRQLKL